MVLVVGVLGLGITVYEQLRASGLFAGQSTYSTAGNTDADTVKTDPMGAAVPSFAARYDTMANSLAAVRPAVPVIVGEPASSRIAKDFSFFQPKPDTVRPPVQAAVQAKPTQPKAAAAAIPESSRT